MLFEHVFNIRKTTDRAPHPAYPAVDYIEADNLYRPPKCIYCSCETVHKKGGKGKDLIHDYDEDSQKPLMILVHSDRYVCQNPGCRKSFVANQNLGPSYTREFVNFLALERLKKQKMTYQMLANTYGCDRNEIRKQINRFSKNYTPLFLPLYPHGQYFLCPFPYQQKYYYFLGNTSEDGDSVLLGMFGYENAVEEIKKYFYLHQNFIGKDATILTDTDFEMLELLHEYVPEGAVSVAWRCLSDYLDQYIPQKRDLLCTKKSDAISCLKKRLKAEGGSMETIDAWWQEDCKNNQLKEELSPIYKFFADHPKECAHINAYRKITWDSLYQKIKSMNKQRVSFESMAMQVMYQFNRHHKDDLMFAYSADVFDHTDDLMPVQVGFHYESELTYRLHSMKEGYSEIFNLLDVILMDDDEDITD